ncbi:hypothetical protein K438DRAFT_1776618 [Mycena galopus ATCC 62051]|nr:hypothetical protein K438DRAFT_1776618 [Mycena galopus ATCC 62051]
MNHQHVTNSCVEGLANWDRMASSIPNAVIQWHPNRNPTRPVAKNSSSLGGRWGAVVTAFSNPSPGRTLNEVYTSLGQPLERQANRAAHNPGLGPHAVAEKVKLYFGTGKERAQRLKLLRISVPLIIQKSLNLPIPNAFEDIVELVTLFPGIRELFLCARYLNGVTSTEALLACWARSIGPPDEQWTFWQLLAAASLSDRRVMFGAGLERLLVEHDSSALCIRYIGGILDFPEFWGKSGPVHAYVGNKLCRRMSWVLKDIGADISALGPLDGWDSPFDYEGVDFLAVALLTGFRRWFSECSRKDWPAQRWYQSFTEFLRILRRPRVPELLPRSATLATGAFEDILPTVYGVYYGRYWTKVEWTRIATRSHALGALQRVATRHKYSPQFPCMGARVDLPPDSPLQIWLLIFLVHFCTQSVSYVL